jgi:hypothetical protein
MRALNSFACDPSDIAMHDSAAQSRLRMLRKLVCVQSSPRGLRKLVRAPAPPLGGAVGVAP